MFVLFFLIAIYISESLKNYDQKYTLQCRQWISFTVNEIIYCK